MEWLSMCNKCKELLGVLEELLEAVYKITYVDWDRERYSNFRDSTGLNEYIGESIIKAEDILKGKTDE